MENNNCENCGFRAKYDNNPKSFFPAGKHILNHFLKMKGLNWLTDTI